MWSGNETNGYQVSVLFYVYKVLISVTLFMWRENEYLERLPINVLSDLRIAENITSSRYFQFYLTVS